MRREELLTKALGHARECVVLRLAEVRCASWASRTCKNGTGAGPRLRREGGEGVYRAVKAWRDQARRIAGVRRTVDSPLEAHAHSITRNTWPPPPISIQFLFSTQRSLNAEENLLVYHVWKVWRRGLAEWRPTSDILHSRHTATSILNSTH
jgi:hypothetical protein